MCGAPFNRSARSLISNALLRLEQRGIAHTIARFLLYIDSLHCISLLCSFMRRKSILLTLFYRPSFHWYTDPLIHTHICLTERSPHFYSHCLSQFPPVKLHTIRPSFLMVIFSYFLCVSDFSLLSLSRFCPSSLSEFLINRNDVSCHSFPPIHLWCSLRWWT